MTDSTAALHSLPISVSLYTGTDTLVKPLADVIIDLLVHNPASSNSKEHPCGKGKAR